MVHRSLPETAQRVHQVCSHTCGFAGRLVSRSGEGQAARTDERPVAVVCFRLSEKGNENHL